MKDLKDLREKLKEDKSFKDKVFKSKDLDDALTIIKEEGFNVNKADLLKNQELSEEELVTVSGGKGKDDVTYEENYYGYFGEKSKKGK